MLTPEQIKKLREAGYNDTKIRAFDARRSSIVNAKLAQEPVQEEPQRQGFLSRVSGDLRTRLEKISKIGEEREFGKIGRFREGLRVAGQVAGSLTDVAGQALISGFRTLPDPVEEPIREAGRNILQTAGGQAGLAAIGKGVEAYQAWKAKNPQGSQDLEAVVNIAALLPIGRFSAGKQVLKPGILSKTGKVLETTGAKKIADTRKSFISGLITPQQTAKVKQTQVPRTREVGAGPFRKSIIEPTTQEARAAEAVLNVPEVTSKATVQRNFNFIKRANEAEAKKLTTSLEKNDIVFPKKELKARLEIARQEILDNPSIVGNDELTAKKLITELNRRIDASEAKGSSLLKLRKDYDTWVKSQKGSNIFSPDKENAFSIVNRKLRQTINDFLDEKATNVAVKESLQRQSSLFNAMDNLVPKAAIEADTAFRRALQRMGEILGTKSTIVQGLAALAGIGGLGAAATFAPAVAVLGIGGVLIWKGGKLVMNPKIRKTLGKVLIAIDKKVAKSPRSTQSAKIATLKGIIQKLLEDYGEDSD